MGTLGVSRRAPLLSVWRIALLFFPMWDLDAQATVEIKSMYLWQTGTPIHFLLHVDGRVMVVGGVCVVG